MTTAREAIERIAERLLSGRAKYFGLYRYAVSTDSGPATKFLSPDLRPVNTSLGLPTLTATQKMSGAHGLYARMRDDMQVLVGFEGGDANAPFVAAYVPSDASALELSATGKVTISSASSAVPVLPPTAVALASRVVSAITAQGAAISALASWAALVTPLLEPPIPGGPLTAALAVVAAQVGTAAVDVSTVGQEHPVGCVSSKLESV